MAPRRYYALVACGEIEPHHAALEGFTADGLALAGGERVEADLVVPIPGFVKRRAETRIIRTALEDLRRRVEATVST